MNDSLHYSSNYTVTSADRAQSSVYPIFEFIFLSTGIYMLVAICFHMKKKKEFSRDKKILFALLISLDVWSIARFLAQIFFFYFGFSLCATISNVFFISYFAGITLLYSFLWYRQHTLYKLPMMENLVSPVLKRFSDLLLLLIILIGIGLCAATAPTSVPRRFAFIDDTQTCIYAEPDDLEVNIVGAVAYVIAWMVQGSILFCFIHILRRHEINMRHVRTDTSPTNHNRPQRLQKLIRNCTIATAICLATDTLACFLFYFFPSASLLYSFLLLDLDYIINVSCALFCFTAWRQMIFPWSEKFSKKLKQNCCCKSPPAYDSNILMTPTIASSSITFTFKQRKSIQ